MAIHEELNPDIATLPFVTARAMRSLATDNSARTAGVIVVPNRDGTDTVLGTNGVAPWVGDTTPPGRPLDIEATSHLGTALIRWGGELEGGIPSDFRCVRIWAKATGDANAVKMLAGELSSAGEVNTGVFAAGTTLDVWATALDNAHDRDGSPAYNESVESDHMQVEILPIVSQQEFDEAADNILAAADESVKAQIERVDADLAAANEAINKKAEETLAAAKQDTAQHIAQVNKDIEAANQKIDETAAKTLADANASAQAKVDAVNTKVDAAQAKADANAAAIVQTNKTVEANKQAADAAQAQLDKTITEHGSVLESMDKDITQAKKDILANADAANNAQTTADGKNTVYMQSTDPHDEADKAALIVPGDLWWQTSAKAPETYWTGEANNSVSVLVDHSDEIVHMWVWNGSRWNNHVLYAQDMLVNGSIVAELLAVDCVEARHISVGAIEADKLAATALYGKVIKGGTFLTANERLIIDDAGLLLKDSGGNATITMLAGDGSATFRDVLIVGGTLTTPTLTSGDITGGTISGATVTGGTIQTVNDAHKGIKLTGGNLDIYRSDQKRFLRANESGLYINDGAKDVLAFFDDGGTWKLKLTGPITSGGEVSGATITGGTIQTSAEANRGVKLVGGNLDMYRADNALFMRVNESGLLLKDGDRTVLGFARTPRTYWEGEPNNSVSVLVDGWQLTLDGAIQSGGEISGAAITGAVIRTNTQWDSTVDAERYRGLVITDGGMYAYKNNGKEEYSLAFTADTGELLLDGAAVANGSFTSPTITAGQVIGANIYTSTDADNRVSITSAGLSVTRGGATVISFDADGTVDLGTSGIAPAGRLDALQADYEETTAGLSQSVSTMRGQVDAQGERLASEIEDRRQYMRFDPDTGLTIGDLTAGDAYSVRLSATRMEFMAGNTTAAYVSNDRLYINNAEVVSTMRIGRFAFLPRENGHMSLQYVG